MYIPGRLRTASRPARTLDMVSPVFLFEHALPRLIARAENAYFSGCFLAGRLSFSGWEVNSRLHKREILKTFL